jgi:hypothetical protein
MIFFKGASFIGMGDESYYAQTDARQVWIRAQPRKRAEALRMAA